MTQESSSVGADSGRCANCGDSLGGPFCSACGQRDRDVARIPLGRLVTEGLGDVFSFDSRVLRTLAPLVRKPGVLTQEYLAGRRASYVPPLRLYVFFSLVMFVVFGFVDPPWSFRVTGSQGETIVSSDQTEMAAEQPQSEGTTDVLRDPAEVTRRMLDRLPQVMFLLVPVFAMSVWLLHRRRHALYVPHLIFSLHLWSFWFLAVSVATLVDLPFAPLHRPANQAMIVVNIAYLYLAQRRVYGGGRFTNVLRTALLGVTQAALGFLALWSLLMLTVFRA